MSPVIFYFLATLLVVSAVMVVISPNPIYSALYLVMTMMGVSFLYFMLGAEFLAAVQLVVYAGAVTVLFVMVVMLFDLKREERSFASGRTHGFIKLVAAGWLCGGLVGAIDRSNEWFFGDEPRVAQELVRTAPDTESLAIKLFTQYLLAFEVLGVLLLVIAVGVVALARSRGGTHA